MIRPDPDLAANQPGIEFFIRLDPTGKNPQMIPASFFRYTWPWLDVVPDACYDARADGDEAQGSMHAKCGGVDEGGHP